jgi:ferric-dicitrate binding protein FerR (iron transport regulator)
MLRYLEGEASEAEVARLQEALAAAPELVAVCAEVSRQHLQLREIGEELALDKRTPELRVTEGGFSARRVPRVVWALAAALVALAAAVVLFVPARRDRASSVFAEVLASENAGPLSAGNPWEIGRRVSLGAVKLATGSVQLRLENGARVTLVAPLSAEFVTPLHVRVQRGQLTADVSGGGKGFVVEAQQAKVRDLGTQFGVNVRESGNADVVVFEGEVELEKSPNAGLSPIMNLNGGEAVSVDRSQQTTRIQSIYSDAGSMKWTVNSPTDPQSLVQSVRDNVINPNYHGYYHVRRGALQPGIGPYEGKYPATWQAPDGQPFPAELLGADLISTFQQARFNPDFELKIALARPATVYVMHDNRHEPPGWLKRDFSPMGMALWLAPAVLSPAEAQVTPRDFQGRPYLTYSLWKREVPAGLVVLGPARNTPQPLPRAYMYGLAVRGS